VHTRKWGKNGKNFFFFFFYCWGQGLGHGRDVGRDPELSISENVLEVAEKVTGRVMAVMLAVTLSSLYAKSPFFALNAYFHL